MGRAVTHPDKTVSPSWIMDTIRSLISTTSENLGVSNFCNPRNPNQEKRGSMKRGMPWSDEDDSSSEESSEGEKTSQPSKKTASQVKSGKPKSNVVDFEALRQYGYKGGPSILKVPPPKESDKGKDWSWSTGVDRKEKKEVEEESKEERQKTREALAAGEQLEYAQTRKEKNMSFSQKEKRKRDLGQASRGKNYVEEEKRLLRENGVYSGFDS